jgi:serine/threonine protein kinase/Flp pilus assembly protein TadD
MLSTDDSNDDATRTYVPLGTGSLVGHYRIVEKVGAGGMGEVYLAEDTKLNRRVALKFLPTHVANDSELRVRFTREAQAVAKLDHPNIVTIYEVSEFEGRPFFAMQYVDGKTLQHYCGEVTLSLSKIIDLVTQICGGLATAHGVGVVHRDIKSANIIVDGGLRPKILDFGLATVQGGEMLTKAGSTLGTITYMSPEQALGRATDHRSDLFSLGIVMYELIAGRTPFKRNNDAATLHAIVSEAPEPLARYKTDVPSEVQRIVSKSLAKNPDERYQSAADLAADLGIVGRSMASGEHESSGRVAASRPSIAVLPFTNMSADPENEYFADGLTEELLNVLAKSPELRVTGRTSSFAFKGKQEDVRGIGQKLGVGTLLEGSVRKAGNRVRITAQLVNAADGFHLWSETYDRVLDDIFAIQDEIAQSVAKAMHVTLFGKAVSARAANPESYALVLRAHQSTLQMTKSALDVAVDLYRKAIELDPEDARAWAGMAMALARQCAWGHADRNDAYPKARHAAEKALALDDALPQAHEAMGFLLGALESRFEEAGAQFRRAHSLAPNDSRIVSSRATWEGLNGRFDEALRLSKLAIELDPLNPTARLEGGRVMLWANDLDGARAGCLRALELSPDMTTAHLSLSWIALSEGKLDEALSEAGMEKSAGYRHCGLALVYHGMGKKEESDRALADLLSVGEEWAFQVANVYAFRRENDKAFEWLERSYAARDSGIPLTRVHPLLRNLHTDPRWPVFLKKIGLSD